MKKTTEGFNGRGFTPRKERGSDMIALTRTKRKKMCLNGRMIKNRRYTANMKNGGIIPEAKDERLKGVEIPCGWCSECVREKRREWRQRLSEEAIGNVYGWGYFATMSISEENMDELEKIAGTKEANEIARVAIRRFTERWRKENKRTIRHWAVAELGGNSTERLHLHAILWVSKEEAKEVERVWKYGNVWIEKSRGMDTGAYVVKYLCKNDPKHNGFKGKMFASKNIGGNYVSSRRSGKNKFQGKNTYAYYEAGNNKREKLSKYYRRKLYNDEEREALRLYEMDRREYWVAGVKFEGDRTSRENIKRIKRVLEKARRDDWQDGYRKRKKTLYECRGGRIISDKKNAYEWKEYDSY